MSLLSPLADLEPYQICVTNTCLHVFKVTFNAVRTTFLASTFHICVTTD